MLTLFFKHLVTVLVATAAATLDDTPTADVIVFRVADSSLAIRANVELRTYGDPQSPLCNAKVGRPGGVYTCPGPNFTPSATEQCKWHSPPAPGFSSCITFDANLPRSIGPDPGGYCILFVGKECKSGKTVLQIGDKLYNTLGCPGLGNHLESSAVASLECWPLSQRW